MANIVFISSSLGLGGAEKMLCFIAESMLEYEHNVSIVNLDINENASVDRKIDDRICVVKVNKSNKSGIARHIEVIRQIVSFSKKFNADVIVGFTSFPNLYARIAAWRLHISSIMSERGDPYKTNDKSLKSLIANYIIAKSDGGVFQTEGAMKFYKRNLVARSKVIANPIFISEDIYEEKINYGEKSIVSVGRLDNKQKRYDIMLEAFDEFRKNHPEYMLKIYGDGSDKHYIIETIKSMGLEECVKLEGITKTPMKEISKHGIFIITSDYEGISNALLEAMAVGMPCVSTDHSPGGARLLIKDRHNGLLAPIQDVHALAKCLSMFADDANFAKSCGENAKKVKIDYSPSVIIREWNDYIKKVVGRRKRKEE